MEQEYNKLLLHLDHVEIQVVEQGQKHLDQVAIQVVVPEHQLDHVEIQAVVAEKRLDHNNKC